MHDLMYSKQIINALDNSKKNYRKDANIVVNVCLSAFCHVAPDDLKTTFSILAKNEGYVHAVLNISQLAVTINCNVCGETWKSTKPALSCPKCGKTDYGIEKLQEFYVDSIEIEK